MDKLTITDITLATKIGTHDWEQQIIQMLKLDLILQTDAKKIAATDAIEHAINYDEIVTHVQNFAHTQHFQLIETFAEKLAQSLLENFSTPYVQLTLHKPAAILQAKDVSITIERQR